MHINSLLHQVKRRKKLITRYLKRIAWLLLPLILSLFLGALLILAVGQNPLLAYANLFEAGFGCNPGPGRCALITAVQFATPLILSGLSATVALRGGFFSIGQAGQMLFGASAASCVAGYLSLPPIIHSAVALIGAALLGSLWGLVPAFLKHFIRVNEIIVTLLLNPIASVLVSLVWLPGVEVSARLSPLIPSTKLSAGIFIALAAALLIYLFLWHTMRGMEIHAVEHERQRITFDMNVTVDIPGAVIPQDHPLALLAQDYTEAVTGPANEGYMLIGAGIPTLCGFGPTGRNPHAPDEWVEISSLPATVAMFAGIIHDYLKIFKGE